MLLLSRKAEKLDGEMQNLTVQDNEKDGNSSDVGNAANGAEAEAEDEQNDANAYEDDSSDDEGIVCSWIRGRHETRESSTTKRTGC